MSTALLEPVRSLNAMPAVRRFTHPGTPTFPRVVSAEARRAEELRVHLPAGSNIGETLCSLMAERGVTSGCGRVLGGSTTHLQYHVIVHADSGDKPFIYGAPIVVDQPALLIAATLTLGRTAAGAPLVHCHGGFSVGDQIFGGHFALDKTIAGRDGLTVMLSLFDGIEMAVGNDSETHYSLLSPSASAARGVSASSASGRTAGVRRVLP